MRLRATVTTDHPIVFVADPRTRWMPPRITGRELVTASRSCVAVATAVPQFGETTFELSVSISRPLPNLIFEGELETPGLMIAITSSANVPILSMGVREPVTPIKIWANALREPDYIQIQAEANFSDALPYSAPTGGKEMDRPTAERLAQAARKLDLLKAEFTQIAEGVKDFSQKGRITLSVATAIHDIQESIFGEISAPYPDLSRDDA